MRKLFLFLFMFSVTAAFAQLTSLPSGSNKKAMVGERVGLTDITINYSRPGVKGREGKVWGQLVYTGFTDLGFGNTKKAPWRAGANENTSISFSNDVKIEGKPLPAGTYGLFIAYDPNETMVIFSRNSTSWGSYYYDEKEDALRVKVKPVPVTGNNEWLEFEFADQTDSSATIRLVWEKLSIPIKVQTNLVNDQLASFRRELRTDKGFTWTSWLQAAQWCASRNVNLDQALQWADSASSPTFGGNTQFAAHATKAQILTALGRNDEAAAIMKNAMNLGSVQDLHQYGRQLIASKKNKEALEIFKLNASKHPKEFTTLMGLARGYSANGDYKTALRYALQAQPLAPDQQNKTNIEASISKLKEGKDINE
jgi:tetratricopeptide (TPR) repeat protein